MLLARFRDELSRFGSIAEASRQIGEPNPLGLRDVCNGRKRLTAELLARLATQGVDALYVLTGKRIATTLDLDPMVRSLLNDFERCSPEQQIELVKHVALVAEGVAPPRKRRAKTAATTKPQKSL